MGVSLQVTSGPHEGQESFISTMPGLFVFGRSSQADFSLQEDRLLSREHFVIDYNTLVCTLKDLGSTNGTKVNGLRIERASLRDGDLITAGDSALVIKFDESSHGESTTLRCPGCGHAFRIGGEPSTLPVSGERTALVLGQDASSTPLAEPILCGGCLEKRRRHPQTDPDYLIEKRLGGGGMGEVYQARHLTTNRAVAIKMMVPTSAASEKAKDYFRREMMVLKDLLMTGGTCHPNVVAFYDIFEIEGQFQLVMEYVAGKNALDWIKDLSTPLPISAAARIGRLLLRRSTTPHCAAMCIATSSHRTCS